MIASCIEGRLRLRHPALTDSDLLRTLAEQVAAVPGITHVEGNPRTGSLLVTHDSSLATADLVAMAESYAASQAEALAAAPAKAPARGKPNVARIKRRTQKIGLATCLAGAMTTSLADAKAAHLVFGLGLAGFAAWHLAMYRRRFLA